MCVLNIGLISFPFIVKPCFHAYIPVALQFVIQSTANFLVDSPVENVLNNTFKPEFIQACLALAQMNNDPESAASATSSVGSDRQPVMIFVLGKEGDFIHENDNARARTSCCLPCAASQRTACATSRLISVAYRTAKNI